MDDNSTIKSQWQFTFVMMPKVVLYDPDICCNSHFIYSHILSRTMQTDCLRLKQVLEDTKFKRTSFYKYLKTLKDIGLITAVSKFGKNNSRLPSEYLLAHPGQVYGQEILKKGWPTPDEVRAARIKKANENACSPDRTMEETNNSLPSEVNNEACSPDRTDQTDSVQNPAGRTGGVRPAGLPSIYLEEDIRKEEEEGTTTTTSIYNQNKTQPVDVKKEVSVMDAKMLFASGHKEQKKKAVDKPKSTSRDHLGVSSEIRDCHRAYSEQMKTHGMSGGVLTKNKADVWGLFLQGQNTPSDGLKVIDYVMSHWKDLKRRYKLSEALPSIYFFKTGYIDPISIEVLSKATSNSRKSSDDSFKEMAEMARVSADRWSAKADRQDEAKRSFSELIEEQKNKKD